MTKATFYIRVRTRKETELKQVEGYELKASGYTFGVHKDGSIWKVTCLLTGMLICDARTKKAAIAQFHERFEELYVKSMKNPNPAWQEAINTYATMLAEKEPHEEKPLPKKRTPKKKPMNTRKKQKHEPFMVRVQNGKVEGVEFMQKNEKSCLWITGKTSAYKDELMKEGFKYSAKKKAWWKRPETWAA